MRFKAQSRKSKITWMVIWQARCTYIHVPNSLLHLAARNHLRPRVGQWSPLVFPQLPWIWLQPNQARDSSHGWALVGAWGTRLTLAGQNALHTLLCFVHSQLIGKLKHSKPSSLMMNRSWPWLSRSNSIIDISAWSGMPYRHQDLLWTLIKYWRPTTRPGQAQCCSLQRRATFGKTKGATNGCFSK